MRRKPLWRLLQVSHSIAKAGHACLEFRYRTQPRHKLADLLELEGANPFRIRAYRNAARVVGELPRSVAAMTAAGEDVAELPGIGKDLAEKIETLAATGHVAVLDEIERRTPAGLLALLDVPGLGPKRARLLNDQLGISALGDLVAAAKVGKIRKLRGFGAKTEQRILQEAEKRTAAAPRIKRPVAEDIAKPLLHHGTQVDLRVVSEASYGAALQYFTGSKAHNIALRQIAAARGLKLNEYGLFEGNRRVVGRTQDEVYRYLGLPYIEPELREDHGEIEAARLDKLPHLVTLADIRGDLHLHTKASDGRASLAEMAQAAQERGYSYLAITDHSKRVTIAHGLDAKRLAGQIDEIAHLNETLSVR
jgi:DNA polymerase (family X)